MKEIFYETYKRNIFLKDQSEKYRSRYQAGHQLDVGSLVLAENHKITLDKSQKFSFRREGPFIITEQITPVNYKVQLIEDPNVIKNYHRNHLIPYFPKEEAIEPLLLKYKMHNIVDSNASKLRKKLRPYLDITIPTSIIPEINNENDEIQEVIPNEQINDYQFND